MTAVSGNVDRIQQRKIARDARRVAPPPMERSDEGPSVRLGTIDNELESSGGAGRATAAAPSLNQIGQLGGPSE
tara:strand:- start:1680 stop:1901 length:222 start_codon:yes stop_codon:yes gene_type:complete